MTDAMEIKVCKFGGTSVADAAQLRRVKAIVEADPGRRWVVPSAPGKRTRAITRSPTCSTCATSTPSAASASTRCSRLISERYREIVARARADARHQAAARRDPRADRRRGANADYCASRGEFINGHIVAALLGYDFVDPAEIVLFDERGVFLPEETNDAVASALATARALRGERLLRQQARRQRSRPSRAAARTSRARSSRAASAPTMYENWTDVSGLLMADPRIVEEPEADRDDHLPRAARAGVHGRDRAARRGDLPGARVGHPGQHPQHQRARRTRAR